MRQRGVRIDKLKAVRGNTVMPRLILSLFPAYSSTASAVAKRRSGPQGPMAGTAVLANEEKLPTAMICHRDARWEFCSDAVIKFFLDDLLAPKERN